MSLRSDVRTALVAALNTVTNIGRVHGYQRYATTQTDYLSLYRTTINAVQQIRAWVVTFDHTELEREAFGMDAGGRLYGRYVYRVDGYLSLDDSAATEDTLLDLAEDVLQAVAAYELNVTGAYAKVLTPNITRSDIVTWGETVCNHVVIEVPVLVGQSANWS